MIVEVEIPKELMDSINSFSKGNEKTIGEVIVKIVESKFKRDNEISRGCNETNLSVCTK